MLDSFEVMASGGSYPVLIEPGCFLERVRGMDRPVILADRFFAGSPALAAVDARAVVYCEAQEASKSLEAVPALIERLRLSGANRQTELVAVGGGVLQDLAGFAASIYMRGVRWTYVPTTILAMADSCIGGKSSINVGAYKNLVGTFHPPERVWIDPAVAGTLSTEQQVSGLLEAAKICYCRGEGCFRHYLGYMPGPGMTPEALGALLSHSLRAKKWFIETDEFDQNERLLLNFGHTFGHAIEGGSHYQVPHGIAVGLGMLCAIAYAARSDAFRSGASRGGASRGGTSRGGSSQNGGERPGAPVLELLEEHVLSLLGAAAGHAAGEPRTLPELDLDLVMACFASDKKHREATYTLILPDATGTPSVQPVRKSAESKQLIRSVFAEVLGSHLLRSSAAATPAGAVRTYA